MSIIERVLAKARSTGAAGAYLEKRLAAGRALHQGSAARLKAPHAPPAQPSRSITLDQEALRRHGLLPEAEFAARVRDDIRRIKWPLLEAALARTATKLERANLLMVASALQGEGKTFSALNLALAFSDEHDCSALLVDADTIRHRLTSAVGLDGERGLTDLLTDDALTLQDVVFGTDVAGLRVLPAGSVHNNAPELLASQKMERLASELAAQPHGNLTLFDTAPLLATNEAQVLSRLTGQVVLVVKSDETPRQAVAAAIELISKSAAVGLVLNHHKSSLGTPYHGEYHGYHEG